MIDVISEIDAMLLQLFPVCRSITGEGNRLTLKNLKKIVPLQIIEYPSGMQVHDWVIPKEWKVRSAWIKDQSGNVLVDFNNSNLHLVSYSIPVNKIMSWDELKGKLHFLKEKPDSIPYRTTYYCEDWGFCLSYNDMIEKFSGREEERFEVVINSELFDGSLSVGELLIPGKSRKEILISTYICHPSLANDNLSGTVMTAFLARELLKRKWEFSFRILFVPETIGAVAYCANNHEIMKGIDFGFVVTTVGGPGKFGYKQSWNKDHFINSMVEEVLRDNGEEFITYPFSIHGSDERQYSSVGYRINTVTISKDKYYEYPHYHTSLDDLSFVSAGNINRTLNIYYQLIRWVDANQAFFSSCPNCEIRLGKHGLYPSVGGGILPGSAINELDAILWFLFFCDGHTSLWEISKKSNIPYEMLMKVAKKLEEKLLVRQNEQI